ncbi:5085_t:CDS:1, partial [Dentiscutata heterogama]
DTADTESEMNCVWEKIATGIIRAANKNIPRKKVSKIINARRENKFKKSCLHENVIRLSKLVRSLKKKIGLRIRIDDKDEINM